MPSFVTADLWTPKRKTGTLWFGKLPPIIREQRRTVLAAVPLAQMLSYLGNLLSPADCPLVPVVRAYEGRDRRDGKRQDILELFVGASLALRDRLHAMQFELHAKTGWFILVRGEWLGSAEKARKILPRLGDSKRVAHNLHGELKDVSKAVERGEGFRVRLSSGQNFLLDVGSRCPSEEDLGDKLALLSHAHPDHAGGVCDTLRRGIPILASPTTIRLLHENGDLSGLAEEDRLRLCPVEPGVSLVTAHLTFACHAVPHSVGSVAWTVHDGQSSLLYSGDLMLRSTVYNFSWLPRLCAVLEGLPGRKTVLLEASRAHSASELKDEAVWRPLENLPNDVVVVCQHNPERLLNSYVQLFKVRYKHDAAAPPCFILSGAARAVLQACWDSVHNAAQESPDALFLKPGNQWGPPESRALYWLDRADIAKLAEASRQRFWFVDHEEINQLPDLAAAIVYDLRTSNFKPMRAFSRFETLVFTEQPGWTQHSYGSDVAEAIRVFRDLGANVFTFHETEKSHRKFEQKHGLVVAQAGFGQIEL